MVVAIGSCRPQSYSTDHRLECPRRQSLVGFLGRIHHVWVVRTYTTRVLSNHYVDHFYNLENILQSDTIEIIQLTLLKMMRKTVSLFLFVLVALFTVVKAQIEINGVKIGCDQTNCDLNVGSITSDVKKTLADCKCTCGDVVRDCVSGDKVVAELDGDLSSGSNDA